MVPPAPLKAAGYAQKLMTLRRFRGADKDDAVGMIATALTEAFSAYPEWIVARICHSVHGLPGRSNPHDFPLELHDVTHALEHERLRHALMLHNAEWLHRELVRQEAEAALTARVMADKHSKTEAERAAHVQSVLKARPMPVDDSVAGGKGKKACA